MAVMSYDTLAESRAGDGPMTESVAREQEV
jgi:hypothetical protein